jgi:DHA2 family multidrug resistance protein
MSTNASAATTVARAAPAAPVAPAAPAAPAPMTGGLLTVTAIALALGTFMQVLDSTIANVSIPAIAGDLGVSTSQGTWVVTSFSVANGISLPLTAWLMRRYGVVKIFVGAVALFTLASFLCGISWNLESLILFRVFQGAASGPLQPGSQVLLIMIFAPAKRGAALGIWAMTAMIAPVCGPILGGYISDNISWPWIFFINVPIGIACGLIAWRNMKSRETPTSRMPVDRTGLLLLVVWVGALQVVLDTGKDADWFNSTVIVVESLVAVIGFIAWLIWELGEPHPIVDLSLFKSRNFAMSTGIFCVGYALFIGGNLLQPLWLQTKLGYTATWAGLVLAPGGVVAFFLSPMVARSMGKIDARWIAVIGIAAFAVSCFMRSDYTADGDFRAMMIPMLVQGVALATFFISMTTLVLNGLDARTVPQASSLATFARITSGSFAVALTTTAWERSGNLHQTRMAEVMAANDPTFSHAVAAMRGAGLTAQQAVAAIAQQVSDQASFLGVIDFFRASGWCLLALIPLIWLTKKSRGGH